MSTRKMRNIYEAFNADLAVVVQKCDEKWQKVVDDLNNSHEREIVVLRHEYQSMADERVAIIESQRQEIDELVATLTPLQIERREEVVQ